MCGSGHPFSRPFFMVKSGKIYLAKAQGLREYETTTTFGRIAFENVRCICEGVNATMTFKDFEHLCEN